MISNKITVIQQQQQKKDKDKDKGKFFQPSGNLLVGIQGPCPSTVKQKGLATTGWKFIDFFPCLFEERVLVPKW